METRWLHNLDFIDDIGWSGGWYNALFRIGEL